MGQIHGVMRVVAGVTEFIAKGFSAEAVCWTKDKNEAVGLNTHEFARRMAKRYGGTEVVIRGSLAPRIEPITPETIALPVADFFEALDSLGRVWAGKTERREPIPMVINRIRLTQRMSA